MIDQRALLTMYLELAEEIRDKRTKLKKPGLHHVKIKLLKVEVIDLDKKLKQMDSQMPRFSGGEGNYQPFYTGTGNILDI